MPRAEVALAADDRNPHLRHRDHVISAMNLLHVRHDFLAEEQLTDSRLCPALSDDVIGHGDEITTSSLEM